jgi:hypothetical protein
MLTGELSLLYGIFISAFTQDKLKDGEAVTLPMNESAVMKAHLAESPARMDQREFSGHEQPGAPANKRLPHFLILAFS